MASLGHNELTHLGLVMHICASEVGPHRFIYWLVTCSPPSHYLNNYRFITNLTLWNKLQWKSNQNTFFFSMKFICKCRLQDLSHFWGFHVLIHWGRVTHICIGNLTTIGSDNGLSPSLHQAIIWTNAGILLIGPLWTNFSEILIQIYTFSFKKMHLKMLSGKWWPFCPSLNVLSKHTSNTVCVLHSSYQA